MPIRFSSRARWFGACKASYSARGTHAFPAAEILEDRTLLTAYLVDTLEDLVAVDGKLSLREAIQAANTNSIVNEAAAGQGSGIVDSISFASSLAGGTITLGGTRIDVTGTLSIAGLGSSQLAISGNGLSQIFYVATGTSLSLSDLTLQAGSANGDTVETRSGGAVHNLGVLNLDKVALKNNSSQFQGGAIYSTGTVGMTDGEISDGTSSFGAGIYSSGFATFTGVSFFRNDGSQGGAISNSGTVTVRDSLFVRNESSFGSAVNNNSFRAVASIVGSTIRNNIGSHGAVRSAGTLTVDSSTIANNSGSWGAGLSISGTATITNSTISGNSARVDGGGIDNSGTLTLVNSTISGNSAEGSGGGIEFSGGTATLRNVTVTGNRADSDDFGVSDTGGGLSVHSGFATARLYNTIVVGNFVGFGSVLDDVVGPFISDSRNNVIGVTGTGTGLTNGTNGNIVGVAAATVLDPVLKDNGGPTLTHALIAGSAALNAGSNAHAVDALGSLLTTDQRGIGFSRIVGTAVDVGAVEAQGPFLSSSIVVDILADEDDGNYDAGDISLREAIKLVEEGGTISFASALAGGTITLTLGQLDLTRDMSIVGLGATELTISGNDASRIFSIINGVAVGISGLTLADGNSSAAGGAIENRGTLAFSASIIQSSSASDGGGIYNAEEAKLTLQASQLLLNTSTWSGGALFNRGWLSVIGSVFSSNTASGHGGAIFNSGDATIIQGSTVTSVLGNTARWGGGISNFEKLSITGARIAENIALTVGGGVFNNLNLFITDSEIVGNVAQSFDESLGFGGGGIFDVSGFTMARTTVAGNSAQAGGGIYSDGDGVIIASSTLSGNSAAYGGGIVGSRLTLTNSTVSGNSATGSGGGIVGFDVTLRNTTVVGNRANSDGIGDGFAGGGIYTTDSSWVLVNSIVAGNLVGAGIGTADDIAGAISAISSHNLIGDAATAGGLANGTNGNIVGIDWTTVIDPVLKNNGGPTLTHELVAGSAAINGGSNALALDAEGNPLVTDQRGFARISGLSVDIGAVESQLGDPTTVIVDHLTDEDDGNYQAGDLSLREALGLVADGGTIVFSSQLAGGSIALSLGRIALDRDVDIVGLGAGQLAISGEGLSQIFFISVGATVTISDITLKNGNADGDTGDTRSGGAIYNLGTLTLASVDVVGNRSRFNAGAIYNDGFLAIEGGHVADNTGTFGGAILNDYEATISLNGVRVEGNVGSHSAAVANSGTLTSINTDFVDNEAVFGGALENSLHGTATIVGGTFSGNKATYGGAISNSGNLYVSGVTFASNLATSTGGALYGSGTITIVASTFSANVANSMAGAIESHGTLRLFNSTLSGNSARSNAGGLRVSNGNAVLRNVTITGNRTDSDSNGSGTGGGIHVGIGTATLYNTLIAGNFQGSGGLPGDVAGNLGVTSSHNLIANAATAGGLQHGNNGNIIGVSNWASVLDPVLRNNGGPTKTHALLLESVAANAGSNAQAIGPDGLPLQTDQRGTGFARIAEGGVDIGAFELANSAPAAKNDQFTTAENQSLTGQVFANNGAGGDSDAEGDPLTVTQINGVSGLVGQTVTLASGAQINVIANGSFAYNPNGKFRHLAIGQSATDSFTYTISDGQGGTSTATVTITITGTNVAPVAKADVIRVHNGGIHSGSLLNNDSDPNSDPFTITSINGQTGSVGQLLTLSYTPPLSNTPSTGGTIRINADGTYIYDPAGDFTWLQPGEKVIQTLSYTIADGRGGTATASIQIVIEETLDVIVGDVSPATTDAANAQSDSDIGIGSNGHVVVAWTHTTSTGDTDVRFRRYDADGNALDAADRLVSLQSSGDEDAPTVAVAADGSFVIGYRVTDGGDSNVVFDLYDAAGNFVRRVQLFDSEGNQQWNVDLAVSSSGSLIAVWQEQRSGNDDVLVQAFDAQGNSVLGPFAIADESTGSSESTPAVAVDRAGNFVVAYGTQSGIAVRRFSASGTQLGVRLLLAPASLQAGDVIGAPRVGRAADGSFVVAYRVTPASGSPYGYWHLLNADGSVRANGSTSPGTVVTSVSMDAIGNFVLGTSRTTLGGDEQAEAIYFNSAGERGDTAVVNQAPAGSQGQTQVALSHDTLAASYSDSSGSGDVEFSLIRQRRSQFGVARPNSGGGLTVFLDSNGDGTFGTGDAVFNFGLAGDIIVVGDWNGDGVDDFGVARSNGSGGLAFFLDSNGNRLFDSGDLVFNFGLVGDIIVVGDWNADGIADLGVARRNADGGLVFSLDSNGSRLFDGSDSVFNFGLFGDIIVVGDWDGDGFDQLGVARRNGSGGLVFSLDSNDSRFFEAGADSVFNFGLERDGILVGDWDGDGKETLGVVRPNGSGGQRIYPDVNENYGFDATDSLFAFDFGLAEDLLLAGAWR